MAVAQLTGSARMPSTIFLSSARGDKVVRERVLRILKLVGQGKPWETWCDTGDLALGDDWEHEIRAAIEASTAAILFVTPQWLDSTFVRKVEIPALRLRFAAGGYCLMPLLAKPCEWRKKMPWLAKIEIRPCNAVALSDLSASKSESALQDFAEEVDRLMVSSAGAEASRAAWGRRLERSYERCAEAWRVLGVSAELAGELAHDAEVGRPAPALIESESDTILIHGDMGAGKSLLLRRLEQRALQRVVADPAALSPVFLDSSQLDRPLEETVDLAEEGPGHPPRAILLLIDGLDRVDAKHAFARLNEWNDMWGGRAGARLVATSRCVEPFERRFGFNYEVPRLSPPEARALMHRIAPKVRGARIVSTLSTALSHAVGRPLFAVLAGAQLAGEHGDLPATPADLAERLIRQVLKSETVESSSALEALGRERVDRGGAVLASEVVPDGDVSALIRTGLVREHDRGLVDFSLDLFADWFAARSLLAGQPEPHELLADDRRLQRWYFPLCLAMRAFGHDALTKILMPLARSRPGFTARIVRAGIDSWRPHAGALPPSLDCAHRLRDVTQAFQTGLGEAAALICPGGTGPLLPTGARTEPDSTFLIAGWYRGDEVGEDVRELPKVIDVFAPDCPWVGIRGAQPARQSAWAWSWVREGLAHSMGQCLDARALLPSSGVLLDEAVWKQALVLTERGDLFNGSIELDQIERALAAIPIGDVFQDYTRKQYDFAELRASAIELRARSAAYLTPRWVGPDGAGTGGPGAAAHYSDGRLLERVRQVFQGALEGYAALIRLHLATVRLDLPMAAALPARLIGDLGAATASNHGREADAWLRWYLEPLAPERETVVDIEYRDYSITEDEHGLFTRSGGAPGTREGAFTNELLRVFGSTPATDLVYRWLRSDLKSAGLSR